VEYFSYICPSINKASHFQRRFFLLPLCQMGVNLQNHSLIGVSHPFHGGFQVDVSFPQHGGEGMSKVVRPDMDFLSGWQLPTASDQLPIFSGLAIPAAIVASVL